MSRFVDALALPADARVDQRVPKKLLLEQGAPTAADKRQIRDGIEELVWVAALKPNNMGVPAFQDNVRAYLEIAVLTATLRDDARATRVTELIHRAIPYPVVLWTEQNGAASLSLAHKRRSRGEAGEVVIDEVLRSAEFQDGSCSAHQSAFLASLALSKLPTRDLYLLYQGLCDRVESLDASSIIGAFVLPTSADSAAARRAALAAHATIQRDIAGLRAQAERETQVNRRVELNLAIKQLDAQLAAAASALSEGAG